MLVKACLNGGRSKADHPRCPITPGELATEAAAAVAAGAGAVHIHPRGRDGRESLAADDVAAAVEAVRRATVAPVGVTTGAWVAPAPGAVLAAVEAWAVRPDFASVNLHEPDAPAVAEALLARGIGVEAGVWTAVAAVRLVDPGWASQCLRILVEPTEGTVEAALVTVDAVTAVLDAAPEVVAVPRLLHGIDATAWSMVAEAARRGWDTRIGFEDTLRLPDGQVPDSNADLVRATTPRRGVRWGWSRPRPPGPWRTGC